MEQAARYWMWARSARRNGAQVVVPRLVVGGAGAGSPFDHPSWEEKAFAEDAAAAHLGGCVWPPRSYSCSFCRREFRSAQALGGHMNIHRRDRARLRQSPPPAPSPPPPPPSRGGDVQQSQSRLLVRPQVISHLVFGATANPNPNSGVLDSSLSLRVPAKACTLMSSPSFSSSTPRRVLIVPEWGKKDLESKDEEITSSHNKRRRLNGPTTVFSNRAKEEEDCEQPVRSQVLICNPSEELDLELRLGEAPKSK